MRREALRSAQKLGASERLSTRPGREGRAGAHAKGRRARRTQRASRSLWESLGARRCAAARGEAARGLKVALRLRVFLVCRRGVL